MKKVISALLLGAILYCSNVELFAQRIERVEPPNWWIGMKTSSIQVLVYGEDIATLNPKIEYNGVNLEQVIRTSNPNYLFLYLNVSPESSPGNVSIKFHRGKKVVQTYNFPLKSREKGSENIQGFTSADVMYLITPDRFANGNPENDEFGDMPDKLNREAKFGRHGGDIKGMLDHLDYIDDMGFTAVWINPVLENDMPDYSYHGYAATDFYKVDKRFGSNEEYKDFIEAASERGIKIIMDMILNHSGSEHWFVKDPPMSNWINNQNDFKRTTHMRNTVQDIHASEYDKKAFSDGWFVRTMPDLNQRNQLMADYLIQNTLWWIEYSGISGIRMDTYPYPDKDFMSDWTCAVLNEYPDFSIVGEEWSVNPAIVSYWQGGKQNHDGYTSCLPSLMDFPLQHGLSEALSAEKEAWDDGLIKMYQALANDFLYADPNNLVIFPDNHDMDRFFTQVGHDVELFKMGLIYILTMRGIPQLYYGTEILMDNKGFPGDHGIIRTDFPGGWDGDKVNAFTGEGVSKEQLEVQQLTKKLLNWRKTNPAIHEGDLIQFAPENGIYAYIRSFNDEKVMVLFNKNTDITEVSFTKFDELISGVSTGKNIISGEIVDLEAPLKMAPKSAVIIEIKP